MELEKYQQIIREKETEDMNRKNVTIFFLQFKHCSSGINEILTKCMLDGRKFNETELSDMVDSSGIMLYLLARIANYIKLELSECPINESYLRKEYETIKLKNTDKKLIGITCTLYNLFDLDHTIGEFSFLYSRHLTKENSKNIEVKTKERLKIIIGKCLLFISKLSINLDTNLEKTIDISLSILEQIEIAS